MIEIIDKLKFMEIRKLWSAEDSVNRENKSKTGGKYLQKMLIIKDGHHPRYTKNY